MSRIVRDIRYVRNARKQIREHERVQKLIQQKFAEEIADATKAGKPYSVIDALKSSEQFEYRTEADLKRVIETQLLWRQAARLHVPMPEGDGMWWETSTTREQVLTVKGERAIRDAIRVEQRQQSEPIRIWLTLFAPLLGAIGGVFAGVMSLINMLHSSHH